MQRVIPSLVAIIVAIGLLPARSAQSEPLVHELNFATGKRRSGITQMEARKVIRFVRTISVVDRRVLMIDALDLPQVRVTTGDASRGYGDVLYLRRSSGRYTLEKKLRWRDEGDFTVEHE